MLRTKETEFFNDFELVNKIKSNQEYLGVIYKKCKKKCIGFMVSYSNGKLTDTELEDVYQDSIIIFYEKIVSGNFELTSQIQTYLNSVCRFQLLSRYKNDSKSLAFSEEVAIKHHSFDDSITDVLDDVEDPKDKQFTALEKALTKMKKAGGQCYQILTLFWYQKKSMKEIAAICNYTNAANAKNQKARCQEKLRKMASIEIKA